jgi:2-polyprenyl-3-methyl-5-hydroxy-6-metoxy-1,4-benzoquinol methylase
MVARDFDSLSVKWDSEPRRQILSANIAAKVRETVPLSSDMHLLDYGCGTGLVAMHLLPHVGRFTGLDSSKGMLSVFEHKLSSADRERVTLKNLDLAAGGEFSGTYDVILAAMLLHHVPEPTQLIGRLATHLTPGGYLCIADLDSEDGSFHDDPTGICHHGFDRGAVSAWLAAAGLQSESMVTGSGIEKPAPAGGTRLYSVFLAVASRP